MTVSPHRVAYVRGGPADETGPEMADAAMTVLGILFESIGGPDIDFVAVESGAHCFPEHGTSLPAASLATILDIGVAFKAPNASARTADSVPASILLRREMQAYASVNELRSYPGVARAISPNIDVVLVRDNIEGLFAMHSAYPNPDLTVDLRFISRQGARRIARKGFGLAAQRRNRLAVCAFPVGINGDRLFIEACEEVAEDFPDVEYWVRKVDAFAGTIISEPDQYDVVVAPSEWGSILTDEFAAACGSVGLAARGNIGDEMAYFEPIHGTAPGKTGKGTVNPVSQIMAGKMLLDHLGARSSDETATRAARCLEQSVRDVLATGAILTVDLGGNATTSDMVEAIGNAVRINARAFESDT